MKSRLCLGEIRPRSSEMLQTQREIFAKAKVISNKHKIVGVDVLDDPLSITLFACMESHFVCMESFLERMESFKECMASHPCVYGQVPDDP